MTLLCPPKIAHGYSAEQWKALRLDPDAPSGADWQVAIAIFDARIRGRFFAPADALIASEEGRSGKTFGFAILAIDCLVIETLQGFREGVVNHNGKSKELFTRFVLAWDAFMDCLPQNGDPEKLALRLYSDCRCALLHSGSTDNDLRVGVSGPTFKFRGAQVQWINRTSLHQKLKREFDGYLVGLRAPDGGMLRKNFKKKMDAICGT
jgi:hypothetical protein